MIDRLNYFYNKMVSSQPQRMKVIRYIISGVIATLTNVVFLFIFTDIFGIWYLFSTIISFIISFFVSFSMQKYWTFQDGRQDQVRLQMFLYLLIAIINLSLNTLGVFLFVHYGGLNHLLAQIVVSILIGLESFFVYRLMFRNKITNLKIS